MDAELFFAAYEASQPDFRVPDSLAGRFTLVSCLKYSPGGQVYLLTGADNKPYILRVAPAEALDRFMREHLTLRQLHDSAFPHPVACFREGRQAFLIREYIPGKPLSELVENGDPMSPARAVKFAREICAILSHLHALDPPLIHRDIKPHNFILTSEERLCLVDLDAASEYRPDSWLDTVVLGTAATAAPEQFGYKRCDMRTDVYGVGMMMVFLMTGDYDPRAFGRAPLRAPKRIVQKCVRFDPEMRYPTMEQLSRALARWQARKIRRTLTAALALVLALGTFGASVWRDEIWRAVARSAVAVLGYANAVNQTEYVFSSPLIESAVRLQLDRPTGPIARDDLRNVSQLFLCGSEPYTDETQLWVNADSVSLNGERYAGYAQIDNLSDLAHMPHLRTLGLTRLGISDLSVLAGLDLDVLSVSGNEIVSLAAIPPFPHLYSLHMADNPLGSLEGIEKFPKLSNLTIDATDVTDFSPLLEISLDSLDAYDLPVGVDLSTLASLSSLKGFASRDLPPDQCAYAARLPRIEALTLFYSGLKNIDFLKDKTDLTALIVAGNRIGSLEALSDLVNIESLQAYDCGLKDLSGIENLPRLMDLDISNNAAMDLSLLDSMPALKKLTLSRDMEDLLPRPADTYPFEIVWRD